jgi:hypothetical protein
MIQYFYITIIPRSQVLFFHSFVRICLIDRMVSWLIGLQQSSRESTNFSRDGVIDWEKLVRFNSASARFARTE